MIDIELTCKVPERFLNVEDWDNEIRRILKKHGTRIQRRGMELCPVKTGNLQRSIMPPEISVDGREATIRALAKYSGYVEYGTRFMSAQPFLRPAKDDILPGFRDDLLRMLK